MVALRGSALSSLVRRPSSKAASHRQSAGSEQAAVARKRWFRVALWLHRWTGLIATPFFLVLCLTGSLLIFHDEIDEALGDTPKLEGSAPPTSWGKLVETVLKPGERLVSVYLDPKAPRRLMIFVAPKGFVKLEDSKPRVIDLATGKPAAMSDPDSTFTGIILKLHSEWFAGPTGELFGGAIALLVLVSLISGLVIYAPYVRNVVFGLVRRNRGPRIVQLDLHNLIGVVVLGWALVVTATGVCLATATLLFDSYKQGELKTISHSSTGGDELVAAPADLDRVVAAAAVAAPDRKIRFVVYPDTDFSGKATFTVFAYGTQPYNERLFEIGIVDAREAKLLTMRHLPVYLTAVVVSEPLHFGNYGGFPLKILWVVNALGALFITGNGAWLWVRRGRPRGVPKTYRVPQ